MKQLRILQVASNYLPERNGIAVVAGNISERLVQLGHDVTVITKKLPSEVRPSCINGVKIIEYNIKGSFGNGIQGEVEAYRSLIQAGDFDILHIHTAFNWTIDAIPDLLVTPHKFKTIFTPHGLTSNPHNYNERYIHSLLEIFPHIHAITCQSDSFDEKPFCIKHGITNISVIPNGVDFQLLNSLKTSSNRDKRKEQFNVLNISNHNKFKGHPEFIKLAKSNPDIQFTQVGENHIAERSWNHFSLKGGCYYRCKFKSQFIKNLKLLVNVSREIALDNLLKSDVFVLTSNWEASPLVIIEAMAAGIPWLSFNVGNLKDHKGGIIVENSSQLNDELRRLKANPDLLIVLAEDGYKHAASHHNWDRIVLMYQDLYLS